MTKRVNKHSSQSLLIQRSWFFLKNYREIQLTVGGLIFFVLGLPFTQIDGDPLWALITAWILMIGGGILAIADWVVFQKAFNTKVREVRKEPVTLAGTTPLNLILRTTAERKWLVDPSVNEFMRRGILAQKFEQRKADKVPRHILDLAPFILYHDNTRAFCGSKVKLASPPQDLVNPRATVVFKNSNYFLFLCSGNILAKQELFVEDVALVNNQHLLLKDDGTYRQYFETEVEHHIGVNVLIISRDGQLLVQRQYTGTAQSPDQFAASASGSLDVPDLKGEDTFFGVLEHGTLREGVEELGLHSTGWPSYRLILLGMASDITRGMVTDFFFLMLMKENYSDFVRDRYRYDDSDKLQKLVDPSFLDLSSPAAALVSIDAAVARIRAAKSDVLEMGLELLRDAVNDPEVWNHIRAGGDYW